MVGLEGLRPDEDSTGVSQRSSHHLVVDDRLDRLHPVAVIRVARPRIVDAVGHDALISVHAQHAHGDPAVRLEDLANALPDTRRVNELLEDSNGRLSAGTSVLDRDPHVSGDPLLLTERRGLADPPIQLPDGAVGQDTTFPVLRPRGSDPRLVLTHEGEGAVGSLSEPLADLLQLRKLVDGDRLSVKELVQELRDVGELVAKLSEVPLLTPGLGLHAGEHGNDGPVAASILRGQENALADGLEITEGSIPQAREHGLKGGAESVMSRDESGMRRVNQQSLVGHALLGSHDPEARRGVVPVGPVAGGSGILSRLPAVGSRQLHGSILVVVDQMVDASGNDRRTPGVDIASGIELLLDAALQVGPTLFGQGLGRAPHASSQELAVDGMHGCRVQTTALVSPTPRDEELGVSDSTEQVEHRLLAPSILGTHQEIEVRIVKDPLPVILIEPLPVGEDEVEEILVDVPFRGGEVLHRLDHHRRRLHVTPTSDVGFQNSRQGRELRIGQTRSREVFLPTSIVDRFPQRPANEAQILHGSTLVGSEIEVTLGIELQEQTDLEFFDQPRLGLVALVTIQAVGFDEGIRPILDGFLQALIVLVHTHWVLSKAFWTMWIHSEPTGSPDTNCHTGFIRSFQRSHAHTYNMGQVTYSPSYLHYLVQKGISHFPYASPLPFGNDEVHWGLLLSGPVDSRHHLTLVPDPLLGQVLRSHVLTDPIVGLEDPSRFVLAQCFERDQFTAGLADVPPSSRLHGVVLTDEHVTRSGLEITVILQVADGTVELSQVTVLECRLHPKPHITGNFETLGFSRKTKGLTEDAKIRIHNGMLH